MTATVTVWSDIHCPWAFVAVHSQLRAVVLRAQHDLKRSGASHEAREVLGGAPARKQTERGLELTENR
jgi:predicted DsbA family dithiol-disulfide isomerase